MPKKPTYIYIMLNAPWYIGCHKFGISNNVKVRRNRISKTTDGFVFKAFIPLALPNSYAFEQLYHRIFAIINVYVQKGSGRTEWFLNLNLITWALTYFYLPQAFYLFGQYPLLIIAMLIYPFDAVLVLLSAWIVSRTFVFIVAFAVYWAVFMR